MYIHAHTVFCWNYLCNEAEKLKKPSFLHPAHVFSSLANEVKWEPKALLNLASLPVLNQWHPLCASHTTRMQQIYHFVLFFISLSAKGLISIENTIPYFCSRIQPVRSSNIKLNIGSAKDQAILLFTLPVSPCPFWATVWIVQLSPFHLLKASGAKGCPFLCLQCLRVTGTFSPCLLGPLACP